MYFCERGFSATKFPGGGGRSEVVASFFLFDRLDFELRVESRALQEFPQTFLHLFFRFELVSLAEVILDVPFGNGIKRQGRARSRSCFLRNPLARGGRFRVQPLDGDFGLFAKFAHNAPLLFCCAVAPFPLQLLSDELQKLPFGAVNDG
jgi:hypothetical protein